MIVTYDVIVVIDVVVSVHDIVMDDDNACVYV